MKRFAVFLSFLLIFSFFVIVAYGDIVTYTQSTNTIWWNETITVNGSAQYTNGTGIYNALVNITVGNAKCNNTTDSTGNYTCRFTAPTETGKFTLLVNVTNSTGPSVTNTTMLNVLFRYGDTPIGKIDRFVYETPIFIQEMSGRIRILFARVTVWHA